MTEAIEFIMTICALTFTSPYYDCSEHWDIQIYEDAIPNSSAIGQSLWDRNILTKKEKISLVGDYKEREGIHDHFLKGGGVLWHEILHMKCKCDWHAHWDTLKEIDGDNRSRIKIPPIPQSVLPFLVIEGK